MTTTIESALASRVLTDVESIAPGFALVVNDDVVPTGDGPPVIGAGDGPAWTAGTPLGWAQLSQLSSALRAHSSTCLRAASLAMP